MIHAGQTTRRVAIVAAIGTILIAISGALGYISGLEFLGNIQTHYIPMAPSTAISFLVLGALLLVMESPFFSGNWLVVGRISAALVSLFGGLGVVGDLSGRDLNFENALTPSFGYLGEIPLARMSPATGIAFLIAGIAVFALISLKSQNHGRGNFLGHSSGVLGSLVIGIGSIVSMTYFLGSPLLYGLGATVPMALTTALGFLMLGSATLGRTGSGSSPASLLISLGRRDWSKEPKERLIILTLIMVTACLLTIISVTTILYRHELTQRREMLQATAQSQARLIEAVASHGRKLSSGMIDRDQDYDAYTISLNQVLEAHEKYEGIGVTGEFTLARREGDFITFVMRHRHDIVEQPTPVAFDSELAEPMRRALLGQSGTIIGLDYRGEMVMAAHEPVSILNLGIVAKIDMDEIREPFLRSSLFGGFVAMIFVGICILLFSRISQSIIQELKSDKKELVREIEERQITEQELRDAYEMLVNAEQLADIGSWRWNMRTGDVKWSDGLCSMHDLEPGEFDGRTESAIQFLHNEDRSRIEKQTLKMISTKQAEPFEYRLVTKNGVVKTARGINRLHFDEAGEIDEIFGTIQDLSESKRTDMILRRVFSETPFMVYIKDRDGRLVFVNQNFAENFDSTVEKVHGLLLSDLLLNRVKIGNSPADDTAVIDGGQTLIVPEESFAWHDGTVCWYKTVKVPFRHPVTDEPVLLCMSVDLTEQKHLKEQMLEHQDQLEEKVKARTAQLDLRIVESENLNSAMVNLMDDLQESKANLEATLYELEEKNSELDSFSYSVSHDLRAPLRAMEGFSQILVVEYSAQLDKKGADYLQRIAAESQRMAHLIGDLLDLARIGKFELNLKKVDLTVLAQEVTNGIREREPERQVKVNIADNLVAIGDSSLLRQTLENLIGNAWKFTRMRPDAEIEIGSNKEDGKVVFFVKDNGVGFNMKYSDKLFSPFQRLHSQKQFPGTGVGLSTVQRIVKRHRGRIWFESVPDQGATFFFTLAD